jgi:hypothetical protein
LNTLPPVMVAVDHVLDRLVGDLANLVKVLLSTIGPAVRHRVGDDHAFIGDDEHRLMIAIAKHIDTVGTRDLGGRHWRPRRLLRLRNTEKQCSHANQHAECL